MTVFDRDRYFWRAGVRISGVGAAGHGPLRRAGFYVDRRASPRGASERVVVCRVFRMSSQARLNTGSEPPCLPVHSQAAKILDRILSKFFGTRAGRPQQPCFVRKSAEYGEPRFGGGTLGSRFPDKAVRVQATSHARMPSFLNPSWLSRTARLSESHHDSHRVENSAALPGPDDLSERFVDAAFDLCMLWLTSCVERTTIDSTNVG